MAENNSTIINSIWMQGSNDFQQRIPNPTQASLAQTESHLFDPMNAQYLNQFVDSLIARIGFTYIRAKQFTNPLREFKGPKLNYGSTIQEIALEWIKAHSFKNDAETLLKTYRPKAEVVYHSQNRQDKYPITINRNDLRTAFASEYGLNDLVVKVLEVPKNSDEYDEFQIMKQLIAFYYEKLKFYKVNLSAVPSDEATGKEFLRKVQTIAGKLTFPNTLYNSQLITNIPVFAKKNELVLIVTPELDSTLNVDTLSSIFNMDKADIKYKKIVIDEFPIPNGVALLTTKDFFECHDTEYAISNFYNPETLGFNYYLHHWGIYSVSPFVPAVLFTTEEGTDNKKVVVKPTTLSVTPKTADVKAGSKTQLEFKLSGTVTPANDNVSVSPDAVICNIAGAADKLNTFVDKYGVLHVSKKEVATTKLECEFKSTYLNPSGETTEIKTTGSYTVQ